MKGIYSDFKGISWDSKGSKPKLVSPSEVVPLLLPCHQPLLFGDTYRIFLVNRKITYDYKVSKHVPRSAKILLGDTILSAVFGPFWS